MIDIENIKQAALAATPGDWKAVCSIPEEGFECFWLMHNDAHFGDIHGPQSGQQLADATYIATANPSAVLELITRLEQMNSLCEFNERTMTELVTRLEVAEQHAAMYQFLASQATQQADTLGPIFRIDIRRGSESTLFNFYSAVLSAMKETE